MFSGCGGLDLGFELAGLKAVMGESVMEAAFNDKKVFDDNKKIMYLTLFM